MKTRERMARFGDRVFDRLRHKGAFTITEDDGVDGTFDALRHHKYALLVTFRRNGEAVPSPVWFGLGENGNVYLHTANHAGKVKRLRNDARVLIAPSTLRGKPAGPAIRGTARLLPEDEWAGAESVLSAAYGPARTLSLRMLGDPQATAAYIEITPGR